MKIKELLDQSYENMKEIEQSKVVGCYYCLKVYKAEEIKEAIQDKNEDTAQCPYCCVDSVIPVDYLETDEQRNDVLKRLREYAF